MLISTLVIGFLLGMRHAMEADHLAAVATLAVNGHSLGETLRLGSVWGLGHTLTLFAFGTLALSMDTFLPERLSQALETAVGLMLVLLGGSLIWSAARRVHRGDSLGLCQGLSLSRPGQEHCGEGFPARAMLVGMVHGMAGSAALIVLALQTVDSASLGLLYIGLFGAGSIAGMSLCAAAMSLPLRWAGERVGVYHRTLAAAIGAATAALGMLMLWEHGTSWTNG